MHEHTYEPPQDGVQPSGPEDPASARTGDPAVDAVLDEVATVAGIPVPEHVAVFERAHEGLRRALNSGEDA